MQQLIGSFGLLALSQLVLMGLFYFAYFRKERLGQLLVLFSLCLIAYVHLNTFPSASDTGFSLSRFLQGRFAVATPGVLWIVAHLLFIDDKKISVYAWFWLLLFQLLRAFATYPVGIEQPSESLFVEICGQLGYLIMVVMSVHVIIMAVRELNNDLLETRRRLRVPFAAGMGLIVALIVGALLAAGSMEASRAQRFLQVAMMLSHVSIFVFTLLINLVTFRLSADTQLISTRIVFEPRGKTAQKKLLSGTDLKLMREIDSRMIEAKFYNDAELTIGALAKLLAVQEYKLRIIINRGLGYKNFNQFLNHYRIIEACLLLEDKTESRQISAIAHSVGFGSLSSFNLAFKNLKGVTPSAYRDSLPN
ncbi:MAG: helix-turn-helix transcriptional regulator [Pseudohongiellaceae bacterium]